MVILLLAILAFVFVLMAKVAPHPRIDFTWVAVLFLTILHLLSALLSTKLP